jgi:nitrate/TMAO reductase-like tetraheme cytochrome c subunit
MKRFSKRSNFNAAIRVAMLAAGCSLFAHGAAADSRFPPVANAKWQEECGSCHLAYPPQLLPAANWRSMMSRLDKHFGADATLDAATAAGITTFLENNAGSGKRAAVDAGTLRITETPWFRREHREVEASAWKKSSIKTPANCGACHTTAERGDFGERNIRIPR